MEKSASKKYYEDEFKFPLWQLIKKRAKEKNTSYFAVLDECIAEYAKTIRYRDTEFENATINQRFKEQAELVKKLAKKV